MAEQMHLSERLMNVLRERDEALEAVEKLPKDLHWNLRFAVDQQTQAMRDAMISAWATLNKIKCAAKEMKEALPAEKSAERVEPK